MHLVTPLLAIGSRDDAANPELLQRFEIDAVLSLEPVRLLKQVSCQMILRVQDRIALPDATIEQAIDFLQLQIRQGRRVLVHCQMGISRSPALVLAYLQQHPCDSFCDLTLAQAQTRLQQIRPQAEPHPALIESLQRYLAQHDATSRYPLLHSQRSRSASRSPQELAS
ncbi:MAG: dual specificity protein phosphatase [Halopseudomonas sp.]